MYFTVSLIPAVLDCAACYKLVSVCNVCIYHCISTVSSSS